MQSFVINNTEWLTNVWWQDLENKAKRKALKEARKKPLQLKKARYDAFCLIESTPGFQAGYIETDKDSTQETQKALASLFAAQFDNCAVRLVFDTGDWVCAIEDGHVVIDSDFFGDPQEANETYNEFFHIREWDKVIDKNNHEDSIAYIAQLSQDIQDLPEVIPLRQEINKKLVTRILVGILCFAAVLFSVTAYLDHQKEKQAQELALKRQETLRQLAAKEEQKQKSLSQFEKVWEKEPLPIEVYKRCLAEMQTFPLVEKGWLLNQLFCDRIRVKADWKRLGYGKFNDLPANAVFDVINPEAKTATSEWKRKLDIQARQTGITLLKKTEGAASLYQFAKDNRFTISATWPMPETRTIPAKNRSEKPKKIISPYHKCIWTLTAKSQPDSRRINVLSNIPGNMIKDIVHDYQKEEWIIQGEFYVQ